MCLVLQCIGAGDSYNRFQHAFLDEILSLFIRLLLFCSPGCLLLCRIKMRALKIIINMYVQGARIGHNIFYLCFQGELIMIIRYFLVYNRRTGFIVTA